MNQKDIAKILGVSPATVSMALRGMGRISNGLREKVIELSRKHHVTIRRTRRDNGETDKPGGPSQSGGPSRSGRVARIGYCGLQDLNGWFHAGTFRGMVEQTGIMPHEIVLLSEGRGPESKRDAKDDQIAEKIRDRVLDSDLAGLIIDPSGQLVEVLRDLPTPKVQIGYFNLGPGWLDAVVPDSFWGGYRLTSELVAKGRRRIACIRCFAQDMNSQEKFMGYRLALEEAGLPFDPALVMEGTCYYRSGAHCAEGLLAVLEPPDAVFLENDWMTHDFVQRLLEEDRPGFRVLKDLALAQFCDARSPTGLPVELDRVELPRAQMGRMAIRHLLDRIDGRGPAAPVTLKVTPVFRPGGGPQQQADVEE